MLSTGQEYCKILNKNALPCIHGEAIEAISASYRSLGYRLHLGSDNSLKSPQISKVSVQTATNTPWMQNHLINLRKE